MTNSISSYFANNENFIVNENYKSFVRLEKFNDSSIDILVLCITSTRDWDKYLEIKEDLGLFIKEKMENLGLSLPSQQDQFSLKKNEFI